VADEVNPIDALQLLRSLGFVGQRILGDQGNTRTLHYRRTWRGISDVVLVYSPDDAEAYRADDVINEMDPFELASRSDLYQETAGSVAAVVAAVLRWPNPDSWPSHFPPASAPGR
jgi:hypothetical protein